MVHKPF